ncbi:MAG: serine protease [Candidatus Paceibacterota bacterium]|jgi:S1-C subfamily serine protease
MRRFVSFIGISLGFVCGVFIASFLGRTPTVNSPITATIPADFSTKPVSAIPSDESAAPKVVSSAIPTSASNPALSPSSVEKNTALRVAASTLVDALVNIICYAPQGSPLHSISATGVLIDAKGIILTNAHVGQYFLLADKGISCTIRSGVPATDRYNAKLIYISEKWLQANPKVLSETSPNGTGEYDFALLAVSSSATTSPLPLSFPYIPLATQPPLPDTPVAIASYGAQFLDPSQIVSSLFPSMVFGSVKDVFTFAENTIDVLSFGGSAIAQEGSSGGGIVDAEGKLVGTITTSTISGAINTRSLSAITASYVRSEYASETKEPLDILLVQSPISSIASFAPKMTALESIITTQLP